MSFDIDRMGQASGSWFETFVQPIFSHAGFRTEMRRRFHIDVTHEIDIWAVSDFASIAVECKDWKFLPEENIKKEFDAFVAKVGQLKADGGVFAINLSDREIHRRYRDYMRNNKLVLWDINEVRKWREAIERYDRLEYQKRLCEAIGIVIREPTNKERTFKFLKSFGKAAYNTTATIAENLAEEDRPRRRRRRNNSRR